MYPATWRFIVAKIEVLLHTHTYRRSRMKTGYLHILEIYFIFLNRKVRHFANAYRFLKCLKRIIQVLRKSHYV